VLVGSTVSFWHEHAVLAKGRCHLFTLTDNFFLFFIACSRFGCRATPVRNGKDGQRVGQAIFYQVDMIAGFDACTGRGTLTV
jgi:hypothetical protein